MKGGRLGCGIVPTVGETRVGQGPRMLPLTPTYCGESNSEKLSPSPWVGISHYQWLVTSLLVLLKRAASGKTNSPAWHSTKGVDTPSHLLPCLSSQKDYRLDISLSLAEDWLLSNSLPW